MEHIKAVIFDLDGVICDTAKYHYQAWKQLAVKLGIDFTQKDNERLKGVSRMESLEILLSIGGLQAGESQKREWAKQKNEWYIKYISGMTEDDILPGVNEFMEKLCLARVKTALGSASKNAGMILELLKIRQYFDCVVDGTMVKRAKPDPEVFLKAAEMLGVMPEVCLVFEDAEAGVEAAKRAGMKCVGIGSAAVLAGADWVIDGFGDRRLEEIFSYLEKY